MKAIVYDRYGSPDVLQYQEIEKPVPADDQVLIQVRASSVNPYDWHLIRGTPSFIRLFAGIRAPKSRRLGADVAGVVEAVGRNITSFKSGDAIFGTAAGSFAEYACALESKLALKPESRTWEQAASVPIAGITALQGLRDKGGIRTGQHVLINGAAGGVGTFAVQIAKSFGARVTGVCSTRNIDLVRSIGADDVVDYTRENFIDGGRRYDLFFDLVGNNPLPACLRVLHRNGTYIGCGGGGPDRRSIEFLGSMLYSVVLAPFATQKMPGLFAKVNTADLNFLADLMRAGKITPVLDRSYALGKTADAIRYLERCHARGKVAINVP
ncbi:MAG: NAD(P)-dependent alcohol dehydrogenase [Terracidiphilus sp.]|jgi:NADPH:quinone reductase-like Zn-dependent oxidoreductase